MFLEESITIDPMFWGAHLWSSIDSIVIVYDAACPQSREFTLLFFHSLQGVIPCFECRNHYCLYYRDHPIDEVLDSKQRLLEWTLTLKNAISERLGRPTLSMETNVRRMESKFHVALTIKPVLAAVLSVRPCDLPLLPQILADLAEQSTPLPHIFLCASEGVQIDDEASNLPLHVLSTTEKQTASENKNRGIDHCVHNTDVDAVLFINCHDRPSPEKTRLVREALLDHPTASLVVQRSVEDTCSAIPVNLNPKLCALHSQVAMNLKVCRNVRFHREKAENDLLERVETEYGNVWYVPHS